MEQKINGLFGQLDNFTCMFYHKTINEVFEWLRVDVASYYGDMYRDKRMFNNMAFYQFQWNGINVQAHNISCLTILDIVSQNDELSKEYNPDIEGFVDVFELTLPSIRLELTGTGLQYMREYVDKDIDNWLRDFHNKPSDMKVTRCDFAFDFVNYMSNILDAIIEYAQAYCTDTGRVLTYKGRGYKCEVHTVGQKKVYLGAPQSDKMLRIYDKRLEQLDSNREVYLKPNKYDNPDSWIRFEFQLRNDIAHNYVYNKSSDSDEYKVPSLFSIFSDLMDDYTLIDPETTKQNRKPYQLWLDLWDWEEAEQLYKMQNADCQVYEPYSQKLERSMDLMMPQIASYIDAFGMSKFINKKIKYVNSLNGTDDFSRKRKARLSMRLAMLDVKEHHLLDIEEGNYKLKQKFIDLALTDV